ncbi:MAG: leucine-rich repeat protein [Clostridia bacterium]|nr:leucine-rich repeat protein [Clostridia bacterium]
MKKVISLITVLCMMFSVVPAFAEGVTVENDFKVLVISGDIEEIPAYTYQTSHYEYVYISEGVKRIGQGAFAYCENLKEVVLPKSLEFIDNDAFMGCKNLDIVVFCNPKTEMSKGYIAPPQVRGNKYFYDSFHQCQIKKVYGFEGSTAEAEFKAVFIPIKTDLSAFNLSAREVEPDVVYICLADKTARAIVIPSEINGKKVKLGLGAFEESKLEYVYIEEGIEEISPEAFKNCDRLTSISFPNSLKTIKNEAFSGCVSLSEINLPDSVTYIGEDAFSKCENLSDVKFPPYVYLQNNPFKDTAFYNNESNRTDGGLYLNKHLLEVDGAATEFQIKPDTVSIAGEVFGGTKLEKITIPASVRCIGDLAFALTDASTEIVFEEGLEILGNQAFYRSKIQNITLPQSLKIIGGYAFEDARIKEVIIPDNVIDVGEGAFEGSSVETVVIGKSVGNIGALAFSNCYNLKSITIPDSVYALGNSALSTRGLEKIHLGKNLQSFSKNVFGYNYPDNLYSITVSEESEYLSVKDNVVFDKTGEKMLFYPKSKAEEEYIIPDGVKIIGEECFYYDSRFTTLTIPESVVTIEKHNNPSKLLNVKYTGTREEWERIDIEAGCEAIKEAVITFSDGSTKNLYENLRYYEKDGEVHIIGLWDTNAKSVIIPGEIDGKKVLLDSSAFKSSKLVTVTLDENIKEIPYCAFWMCKDLQHINLENVEHIDSQAFMYCTNLKDVNLLNIKSWAGISEDRLDKKRMQLKLIPNPWLYTYNTSSIYTIFYGARIENLRIKWPEENFEEGAQTFPAFFLNAEIKNVYFENFTVSPSFTEFYGIDTSRYIRQSDPDVDLAYPSAEMTIFGNSEKVKEYAREIGVNFKYTD